MKRFILFAFVFALGCNGTNCPEGKRKSNGVCCNHDSYYNKVAKRCEPCNCDSIGAKNWTCGSQGQCDCYDDYTGLQCKQCKQGKRKSNGVCCDHDSYYNQVAKRCEPCNCDSIGAKTWTCGSQGQCDCYDDYTGLQCKQCKQDQRKSHGHCCLDNHYFEPKTRLCTPCHCDSIGARRPGSCDSQGQCDCYNDYTGLQCNQCIEGQKMSNGHCCLLDHYFHEGTRECRYCRCNKFGAKGGEKGECAENGDCYCYAHYRDGECGSCESNAKRSNNRCCLKHHYYSEQDDKCKPCNCHQFGAKGGKKGHCDGKGQCSCIGTQNKGLRCQDCASDLKRSNGRCCKKDQYYAKWANECRDCRCDENGAKGGTGGGCNKKGQCYCKPGFSDSECSTCSTTKEKCCKNNQYLDPDDRKCYNCNCHASAKGGTNGECSSSGQCHCKRHRFGKKCDKP